MEEPRQLIGSWYASPPVRARRLPLPVRARTGAALHAMLSRLELIPEANPMPLPPEDMFAIQELYARYNNAVDSGAADAWAATFTADATFNPGPGVSFKGTADLRAFAARLAERFDGRHWNNNLVVEAAPGGATGSCYLLLVRPGRDGGLAQVTASGFYRDELAKGPDGWRFKSRHATIEGEVPMKP